MPATEKNRSRLGSGTLIFVAFMVLVFLFSMGLFQWFTSFVSRANKRFNQANIARLLAESALNEAVFSFSMAVNDPSHKLHERYAQLIKGSDETDIDVDKTIEIARRPIEEGGFGLSLDGKKTYISKVTIKIANERKLTDVDRRGLILFSVEVAVGSFRRIVKRGYEFVNYDVVPPNDLGQFTFAAFNWTYYRARYKAHTAMLLRHKVLRAWLINKLAHAYATKYSTAVGAHNYCVKVAEQVYNPPSSGNGTPTKKKQLETLADQLDNLHKMFKDATIKNSADSGSSGGDAPKAQFTLPMFFQLLHMDPAPLSKAAKEVYEIDFSFSGSKSSDIDRYRFRSQFRSVSTFMESQLSGIFKEINVEELKKGRPTHLSDSEWESRVDSRVAGEIEDFCREDIVQYFQMPGWGSADSGKKGGAPIYATVDSLKTKDLEFHFEPLPIESGEMGTMPTVDYPPKSSTIIPKPQNGQPAKPLRGANYFYFQMKDFGANPAPNTSASQTSGGSSQYDTMTAEELVQATKDSNTPGAPSPDPNAQPEETPNSNMFKKLKGANDLDDYLDRMDPNNGSFKSAAFTEDLTKWEEYKKKWVDQAGKFKDLNRGSKKQLEKHEDLLKFATIDDCGTIRDKKTQVYVATRYNELRACYLFPSPDQFAQYMNVQAAMEPKNVLKISGLFFIKGGPTSTVTIPMDKYSGQGMIACEGNLVLPKGLKKNSDKEGNLILIAGKDIVIGGDMDCSCISNGSFRTPDSGASSGGDPRVINGQLIVDDTLYGPDGGINTSDPERVKIQDYLNDDKNKLPQFEIKLDPELMAKDVHRVFVLCPYRAVQLNERVSNVHLLLNNLTH